VAPAYSMERITTLERLQQSAREEYEDLCHAPCVRSQGLPDQVIAQSIERTEREVRKKPCNFC
jgi:hypothetical protein